MTSRRDFSRALAAGAGLFAVGTPVAPAAASRADPAPDAPVPLPRRLDPSWKRMIAVAGGELPVWDSGGKGAPVVLIHANTGTAAAWEYQIEHLLRQGCRVIAFSRRGTAEASAPAAGIAAEITDLLALLDALGVPACHVVGTASGGMLAARFACQHQAHTVSLTISCSVVAVDDPVCASILANLADAEFHALPSAIKELSPSYRATQRAGVERWLEIEGSAASAMLKRAGTAAGRFRSAMSGAPQLSVQDLGALVCPVLLVYGDADMYSPPPLGRRLATFFRRCRLVVIPEAGHAAHWEQPVRFNRELATFLNRVRRR
jgi:pimeloyl-ACP methyl ester carboxylesterase